jgi:hypothetical protein
LRESIKGVVDEEEEETVVEGGALDDVVDVAMPLICRGGEDD